MVGVVMCEPLVALDPPHAPLAEQEVALVEAQVSVEEFPLITEVCEAERVSVGVGVGVGVDEEEPADEDEVPEPFEVVPPLVPVLLGAVTETDTLAFFEPPAPVQVSV